jgi:hypothetical protein
LTLIHKGAAAGLRIHRLGPRCGVRGLIQEPLKQLKALGKEQAMWLMTRWLLTLGGWVDRRVGSREAGMSTAEYAVGIVAAVSMAAALIAVARSDAVRGAIARLIQDALGSAG